MSQFFGFESRSQIFVDCPIQKAFHCVASFLALSCVQWYRWISNCFFQRKTRRRFTFRVSSRQFCVLKNGFLRVCIDDVALSRTIWRRGACGKFQEQNLMENKHGRPCYPATASYSTATNKLEAKILTCTFQL